MEPANLFQSVVTLIENNPITVFTGYNLALIPHILDLKPRFISREEKEEGVSNSLKNTLLTYTSDIISVAGVVALGYSVYEIFVNKRLPTIAPSLVLGLAFGQISGIAAQLVNSWLFIKKGNSPSNKV